MTNFSFIANQSFSSLIGNPFQQDACSVALEQFKILTQQSAATLRNADLLGLFVAGLVLAVFWLVIEFRRLSKNVAGVHRALLDKGVTTSRDDVEPALKNEESGAGL